MLISGNELLMFVNNKVIRNIKYKWPVGKGLTYLVIKKGLQMNNAMMSEDSCNKSQLMELIL